MSRNLCAEIECNACCQFIGIRTSNTHWIDKAPKRNTITCSGDADAVELALGLRPKIEPQIWTAQTERSDITFVAVIGLCHGNSADSSEDVSRGNCDYIGSQSRPDACSNLEYGSRECDAARARFGLPSVNT